MADDSDENENDILDILWMVPGIVVTAVVLSKWWKTLDLQPDESVPIFSQNGIIFMLILAVPWLVLFKIGEGLRKTVIRGKMSWEAYWTAFFGISGPIFVFMGVTGVDDLFAIFGSFE